MGKSDHELEVKYLIANLGALRKRLETIEAQILQPRTHEVNLRFDTTDRTLTDTYQVLRLRQDKVARLTYKGPSKITGGVRDRVEIEFVVSDFQAAQDLFEALGYQVSVMYEKHRTTYQVANASITLDEMPYGNFAEIEGPDPESILAINQTLNLNWEQRILESYILIFERLRKAFGFEFRDLSFANFKGLDVDFTAIDITPADTHPV